MIDFVFFVILRVVIVLYFNLIRWIRNVVLHDMETLSWVCSRSYIIHIISFSLFSIIWVKKFVRFFTAVTNLWFCLTWYVIISEVWGYLTILHVTNDTLCHGILLTSSTIYARLILFGDTNRWLSINVPSWGNLTTDNATMIEVLWINLKFIDIRNIFACRIILRGNSSVSTFCL